MTHQLQGHLLRLPEQYPNLLMETQVRGKFWKILIVGVVTYVVFIILGVNFAILLVVMTELSVLIPLCRRRGGHRAGRHRRVCPMETEPRTSAMS